MYFGMYFYKDNHVGYGGQRSALMRVTVPYVIIL